MILRRVIKHFREQEWTAIALDFLIVVVGVFVGLQVSNWNDDQKENALSVDYLQRLHDDMTLSIDATTVTEKFILDNIHNVTLVLDSLETCKLAEENRDAFANGLYFASVHIPATFADGTLLELQSSGRLGLLKNTQIRDLLIEADREIKYQTRTWPAVRMRGANQTAYMDQVIIFRQNEQRSGFALSGWGELDIDFEELCQDRKFRAAFAVHERLGYLNLDWLNRNLENFREVKAALEAELVITAETTGPDAQEQTP